MRKDGVKIFLYIVMYCEFICYMYVGVEFVCDVYFNLFIWILIKLDELNRILVYYIKYRFGKE